MHRTSHVYSPLQNISGFHTLPLWQEKSTRVVVNLFICGVSGPGFECRSSHYDFKGWISPASSDVNPQNHLIFINIVAAFRGMHVSPAKHSYAWLPRKCDYRTDRQTDAGQSDPYVPLCFAGDTINELVLLWFDVTLNDI